MTDFVSLRVLAIILAVKVSFRVVRKEITPIYCAGGQD